MADRLDRLVDELLWSAWTELGVPGTARTLRHLALDLEALVAHTPWLCGDRRLLGLAFDWCAVHGSALSTSRLRGIVTGLPRPAHARFLGFATSLESVGLTSWPSGGEPLPLSRERSTMAFPLQREALVQMRLRAVCGTTATGEVLLGLLAGAGTPLTASQLQPAGMSRRSTERALADLVDATLVADGGEARNRTYLLRGQEHWQRLLRTRGLHWVDWSAAWTMATVLRDVRSTFGNGLLGSARALEALQEPARALGVPVPSMDPADTELEGELRAWVEGVLREKLLDVPKRNGALA